tara:strand:+ start:383 stop:697 length:315 start_codon:yes stop_codon:yes gene_type:complete
MKKLFDDYFTQLSIHNFSTVSGVIWSEIYGTLNNLEITSLPQANTACSDNLEGSLSTTLYGLDPGSDGDPSLVSLITDTYSIPVKLEVSFSIPRANQNKKASIV